MPISFIVSIAVLLLGLLLLFDVREKRMLRLVTKTLLSLLFVATALLTPAPDGRFYPLLVVGLVLCLAGDVFLALKGPKMFLAGLVAFFLGHTAYLGAFITIAEMNYLTTPAFAFHAIIAALVLRWLRPRVGRLANPVMAYIVVITAMVVAAWTIFGTNSVPFNARLVILSGAVLFNISDLFVARQRFVKKTPFNQLIGLPTYYTAQFLLAFSPTFL